MKASCESYIPIALSLTFLTQERFTAGIDCGKECPAMSSAGTILLLGAKEPHRITRRAFRGVQRRIEELQ